jgi:DNA-directed RNA polymerase beta subunit
MLRKINLPLDASAKVTGPRLLHGSQWGYIDPLDTPDGGNVGTHKHLAIMTKISNGSSGETFKKWLLMNTEISLIEECDFSKLYTDIKVIINGAWYAVTDKPLELVQIVKYNRRVNIITDSISITFDISEKSIYIYTDSGRLLRPIYYMDDKNISIQESKTVDKLLKDQLSWEEITHGIMIGDVKFPSLIDFIDSSESNDALICLNGEKLKTHNKYTHLEIEPSLLFGILGNQVIFPEHNPPARNLFSCGQTKQAVSLYHSNFQNRFDKMGVILNYGQNPLIKSKYSKFINNNEHPHGENTIVAIMSLNGYNVEDAILVNEGSVKRGLFRTTYYTTYETSEESAEVMGSSTETSIHNVGNEINIKTKPGYEYNNLDELGLIKENTSINDKMILIGKSTKSVNSTDTLYDASIGTKKGQLGYVDKTFISDNQEGFRVAKVRIREERIPSIGDKMASRAGQKGTIGLIIPECDMPFTADGIKPDLIINPHAIPSRMTIGQLIEMLLGKICTTLGSFSDCTAFMNKGGQEKFYGNILTNMGFHSSGNEIMYDGITGKQLDSMIFMGPTYYMRLKHMVKDKINYRARGPVYGLTRQTVQGRANDGGLRIGEMERDGVIAHGMSSFLKESFMIRGDEYSLAVCNNTGSIAIYNAKQKQFYSPLLDGPVQLDEPINENSIITNISRFGFSFSVIKIPYCLKLLIQELQTMNISMKLITEDNINQLSSMNYSIDLNKDDESNNYLNNEKIFLKARKHDENLKSYNLKQGIKEKQKIKDLSEFDSDDTNLLKEEIAFDPENSPSYAPESNSQKDSQDDSQNSVDYDGSPAYVPTSIDSDVSQPKTPRSEEFQAVMDTLIEDISEYKNSRDDNKDKQNNVGSNNNENDNSIKDDTAEIITIKTENLKDIVSKSKDSILQPMNLIEESEEQNENDDTSEPEKAKVINI